MNVAIAQQQAATDVLQTKLLPSFRGYTKQNKLGQIQICVEKANPRALVTTAAAAGATTILCDTPSQFNPGDLLILSTFTVNAEMGTVDHMIGAAVVLTAATTKPHAIGDELLKVSRAFAESNIVDGTVIQYPLSDRQSSINQVGVQYVDSPSGFQARTLNVNDYANQSKVHAINNQSLDGSCIDSYFQAWRIGQWQLALQRDLGKFVSLRSGIAASDLEVGDDVVAVSAPEHGLQCVPFRIIEMGFTADNEVDIVGQLYSTDIYDDEAPQSTRTVPTIFNSATNASVDADVPPAPIGMIANAGKGIVTFSPITFSTMVNTTGVTSAIIVLLYADQATPATAKVATTALPSGVAVGTAITLHTDTDLTGVVLNGEPLSGCWSRWGATRSHDWRPGRR